VRRDHTGRDARRAKLDIVYSTEVATPHVKWASPFINGPIRAFVLSSVHEGRVVSELMQRLSLDVRAVSIDPRWDVNRWSVDRYAPYNLGIEPPDYSPAYAVLEEELTATAEYDVIVMHSVRGWNELPEKARASLLSRVKNGTGWVFVHPHLGSDDADQSLWQALPLVDVPPTTMTAPGAGIDSGYPQPPTQAMSGAPWKKAADHYITNGLPLEALPYPHLRHYRCGLAKGAQALITGDGGSPVVAVKQYGKGRVVSLAYHNYALFPELSARRGELNENFWEYLYSLLLRSIVWAAAKEPPVMLRAVTPSARRFSPSAAGSVTVRLDNAGAAKQASLSVTVRDEFRSTQAWHEFPVRLAPGENAVQVPLPKGASPGGRHFVDTIVSVAGKKADWGTGTYEVTREAQVGRITLDAEAVPAGGTLTGTAQLKGKASGLTLRVELWDGLGRLLDSQSVAAGRKRSVAFRVKCPEALTHIGWVKCRLLDGARTVHEARAETVLTAPRRKWEDYNVILPWLHDGLWPWTDLIESQYRTAGITSTGTTSLNFALTTSMHTPGFGVYWWGRQPYVNVKQEYGRTKDKKLLVRHPCFHTEEFRKPVRDGLRKRIPGILKYSPLAYFIADESSVTAYDDAFDLCWSPATLVEFRKWLRKLYRTLDALNAEWGTKYRAWEKVMPVTWEEAQARRNPAPWVDHRLFMNRTLVTGFAYARDTAKRVDPHGMVTVSGTQAPSSHNGCDWWQMDQTIEYLQPYSVAGQDEMHRSFKPGMLLTGFTGYSQYGPPLEYEIWHRFLHGHCGASIFWGYSIVDPDLSLNRQGRSMEKTFGLLRGEGILRTVRGLDRVHDKIALHFSMASGHTWWVSDGQAKYDDVAGGTSTSKNFARFLRNREAWGTLLEDTGYQYNYVSYEQLENGCFAKAGYKVLILPGSIALSTKEVAAIREFVKKGGTVIADVMPGTTTVHGKPLPQSSLSDLFAGPKYGRGRAWCADRWAAEYRKLRFTPEGEEGREMLRELLEQAGIRPRVQVMDADGVFPMAVERVSWSGGGLEVLALLKEMRGEYFEGADGTMHYREREGLAASERLRLAAKPGHWYDLRAHKHLGELSDLRLTLREADPVLLAILPYQVKGLKLSLDGGAPGGVVKYAVSLNTGAAKAAKHVVKIEVFTPGGEKHFAYSKNLDTRNGAGAGQFRLALNDTLGAWRVVATDVISGASAEKSWRVR